MALDATIGGANANSYQDRTEAGLYFADHLYATVWSAASTANQDKALIMATRRLEQEEYIGEKVTYAQALKWPRIERRGYSVNFALTDLNGNGYDSTSIPKPVKYAQCEIAMALLASNIFGSAGAIAGAQLSEVDLGPIKLTFDSASSLSFGIPDQAMRYLRGILITAARLVRA